jgi:hypothetical protein
MSLISQLNVYQKRSELSMVNNLYLVIKPEAIIKNYPEQNPLCMLTLYYKKTTIDKKELVGKNQGLNAKDCP